MAVEEVLLGESVFSNVDIRIVSKVWAITGQNFITRRQVLDTTNNDESILSVVKNYGTKGEHED